jgi:D-alanyl-D-alanine carboxypeptidase/D-alanyl-D-alanine-endopeptidase (penicillin-binding protein 4)
MKKVFLVTGYWLLFQCLNAQSVKEKLGQAYRQFESDSQLRHAISSLYVINAKTGEVVFDRNSQVGLAPASTQKIITAATAFELLGKDYRYKTELAYNGKIENDILKGSLCIVGHGDPTLGSWRYKNTSEKAIFAEFGESILTRNIKSIDGITIPVSQNWETQTTPNGWIWQDIGNYYGAGASAINWRENQFDVQLKSLGEIGTSVSITGTIPELFKVRLISELKSAEKNSGDNAYIYLAPSSVDGVIRGTIPVNETSFKISGSLPDPPKQLVYSFLMDLSHKIPISSFTLQSIDDITQKQRPSLEGNEPADLNDIVPLYTHQSPPLDSIIYWFLQKSINLYGEALIKTFAYEKKGFGATDTGVVIVKDFWKQKGLDENELNIYDGSGLSPLNRVTTHAQVEILKYAKQQPWFPYFFNALPEYNGMKMKSGSISDVKGFCGYHTSGDGMPYIFSFLVNNYSGTSSGVVKKMYQVLDALK